METALNWRGVVGYEEYYKISPDGQVWSVRSARLLSTPINKHRGYKEFSIKINGVAKTAAVHQEVAKAYIGPANGLHIRHKNGDPTDNRLENLEYGTPKQNQDDRRQPDYLGKKLLTELLWRCVQTGAGISVIAAFLGVTHGDISNVLKRNFKPMRQLRREYPLNKSINVESLRRIIESSSE
jgi:hypothetical protein